MRQPYRKLLRNTGSFKAVLLAFLSPAISFAAEPPAAQILGDSQLATPTQPILATAGQGQMLPAGPAFDVGDSETRKLELSLAEPLSLSVNNFLQTSSSGLGSVMLDSSLNFNLSDYLDITASLGAGKSRPSFQPLGSIHCQNGVLEKGSYRASDCHFINQTNVLQQNQVALGLRFGTDNFSSSAGLFRREGAIGQQGVVNYAMPSASPVFGSDLLAPVQSNPLLAQTGAGNGFSFLGSESSGLDLEFQLGLTTDSAGDVQLGLQLTRVLNATFEANPAFSPGLQTWKIASPFDSAKFNLDWSKGNFSGGIQGYYREQVQFLNRQNLDSSTTFDVHFTWRAPWNANFSVGTSNVLNAGSEDNGIQENGLQDPFEAVYGRIPYVRYQQDL